MEDREVGVLWKELYDDPEDTYAFQSEMVAIIRKLVEERANVYRAGTCGYCAETGETEQTERLAEPQALRDFGIDPKTWGADHD